MLPEKSWQGETWLLTDTFSRVTDGPHNLPFWKIYSVRKTPAFPKGWDDLDSVPQKHPSSVARELSTVLEKYKDVSSAKFSIQENEPEATQGKKEF